MERRKRARAERKINSSSPISLIMYLFLIHEPQKQRMSWLCARVVLFSFFIIKHQNWQEMKLHGCCCGMSVQRGSGWQPPPLYIQRDIQHGGYSMSSGRTGCGSGTMDFFSASLDNAFLMSATRDSGQRRPVAGRYLHSSRGESNSCSLPHHGCLLKGPVELKRCINSSRTHC